MCFTIFDVMLIYMYVSVEEIQCLSVAFRFFLTLNVFKCSGGGLCYCLPQYHFSVLPLGAAKDKLSQIEVQRITIQRMAPIYQVTLIPLKPCNLARFTHRG